MPIHDDPMPCPHPNLDDFTESDLPCDLCLACLVRIHDAICDCDLTDAHATRDFPRSAAFRTHALDLLALGS